MCDVGLRNSLAIKNHDKKSKTTEIFAFYTGTQGPDGMRDLSEKLPQFMRFCLEFKEQAQRLIVSGEVASQKIKKIIERNVAIENREILSTDRFVSRQKSAIKKYYLGAPFGDNYLTQKEFGCLKLFFLGRTAKQIAQDMGGISYRTVEKHWVHIKSKAACEDVSELRAALLDNIFFAQELKTPHIFL